MKTFSIASILLAAATAAAVLSKRDPPTPPPKAHAGRFCGVHYPRMTTDYGATCSFLHEVGHGSEFGAQIWGRPQAAVAHDIYSYWFWIRGYDPKRYYFCEMGQLESLDLIPPLRPSFHRWLLDQGRRESESFRDGPYTVEVEAKDGMVTTQRYIRDGQIEAEVRVLAFQDSSGMKFPAMATLEMPGVPLRMLINMGPAEANPAKRPDTKPPEGLKARRLAL